MATAWPERMVRVLDHIHANLDEPIEPATLADLAGFSLFHFHRVFRGMVGESVMGYVRRQRLERAAFRLRHAGDSVTTAAFAHGYESHEAFTRAFRAHFGIPPRDVRAQGSQSAAANGGVLRHEPTRHIMSVSHVGPYESVGVAWEHFMAEVLSKGLEVRGPTLGLVYDDPEITDPTRCRYEACWELASPDAWRGAIPAGFQHRTLPAGRAAVMTHVGSYETILDTYVALLGQYLPRQNEELCALPVVERYLDPPGSVPESEMRTEVIVMLQT
jgi:AraC family transcriptional regulator